MLGKLLLEPIKPRFYVRKEESVREDPAKLAQALLFMSSEKRNLDPGGGAMNGAEWQGRWDPLRELQREVGRLFDSLDPFQPVRNVRQYPPLNVYDAGEGYILSAQLPGLAADEVELTITGETLTMRGERKRPEGVKDDSYRRQDARWDAGRGRSPYRTGLTVRRFQPRSRTVF